MKELDLAEAPITGSTVGRASMCAPSVVLPRFRSSSAPADRGSAIHDHLRDRAELGVQGAVDRLDDAIGRWGLGDRDAGLARAICMGFEWSPPLGSPAEKALCLLEDGRVVRVRGGHGRYRVPRGALFALTIDVMWAEPEPLERVACDACGGEDAEGCALCAGDGVSWRCPEGSTLWVADYKTGRRENVEEVAANAQATSAALLGARWTGARAVMPAVIFVRRGPGEWDVPDAPLLEGPQLDAVEAWLRELREEAERQAVLYAAGAPLDYVTGAHCARCDAAAHCPAQVGIIRTRLGRPVPRGAVDLDPDELAEAAAALGQIDAYADKLRRALRAVAERLPERRIALGGGLFWGEHEVKRTTILPGVAVPVLAEEVGEELAREAVRPATISRDAIKRAVAESHAARGIRRQKEPAVRRIMAKIGEAGGLLAETTTWWSTFRPTPALPDGARGAIDEADIEEGEAPE